MIQSTARANFAARLFAQLSSTRADENVFCSPLSLEIALAMCAAGARGETRESLCDLLGLPEDLEEQNQQYARLLSSWSDQRQIELVIANAVWGQHGFTFQQEFNANIAEYYQAVFEAIDFRVPIQAVERINAWTNAKTRAKIKKLLEPDMIKEDTQLVLTNAIYFLGEWENTFEKKMTREARWLGGSEARDVSMMSRTGGYLYYETDEFQAVNIPYKGRHLSMLVVLPRKVDGLASLERDWIRRGLFKQTTAGFDSETVALFLPRFKVESSFRLRSVLCAMHADLPFSPEADFSGISDEPMMISEVVHKAFAEVDEKGTEAAAATAVIMSRSAGAAPRPPDPIIFRADHPFLFFIWDRTDSSVYFSGRMVEPS